MARLPIIDPEKSTGKTHELLAAVQKKLGLVPNSMRVMVNSPAVLEAYIGFSGALDGGSLNAKTRERIALGVAEANQCNYCLAAHSTIGKLVGLNEAEILESRQARSTDSKSAAALQFSRQVIEKRGAVTEAEVEAAIAMAPGMGLNAYFAYTVDKDKPLTVNYRLWLQDGLMKPEDVAALSRDFVEPVTVTVQRKR